MQRLLSMLPMLLLGLGLVSCARPVPFAVQQPLPVRPVGENRQLLEQSWLLQPGIWRLRQSALLEIGPKRIPLEGFIKFDVTRQQVRLVAMEGMGLVLFDLTVTEHGQQLHRAMPQLRQQPRFAAAVAGSIRRIFLQPLPQEMDHRQERPDGYRLWRLQPGGSIGFLFAGNGDLVQKREVADEGDWQVRYFEYREEVGARLPRGIVLDNFRQGMRLTLWLREAKREDA